MEPPSMPEGEDMISMQRHVSVLKEEFGKKKHCNLLVVNSLMEKTYPIRRAAILSGDSELSSLLQQYPFLQSNTQVDL